MSHHYLGNSVCLASHSPRSHANVPQAVQPSREALRESPVILNLTEKGDGRPAVGNVVCGVGEGVPALLEVLQEPICLELFRLSRRMF